ncbi:hypothetical protein CVT26_003922 [Gymnopilus dilepis]|uniref:Uncharacterized protein n=1 Tax=Gymnopilus dilepis TaxID=231916 RepID=A0A409YUS1_9AGAR|nr:hypothetical protein CVT26_003922 [Gymnopilus dilepis]
MIILDTSETGSSDERSPLKGSGPTSPTMSTPPPPPPYGAVQPGPGGPHNPHLPPQYFQSASYQGPASIPQGYMASSPSSTHFQHYQDHRGAHHVHYQHTHGHGHGHGRGRGHGFRHFPHPHYAPPHSPHHPHHHPEHHDPQYPHHQGRRRRSPFIRFCRAWTVAMLVLILWALLMDTIQINIRNDSSNGNNGRRPRSRESTGEEAAPEYRCPCEVEVPSVEVPVAPGRVLPIRYPPVVSQLPSEVEGEGDAPKS